MPAQKNRNRFHPREQATPAPTFTEVHYLGGVALARHLLDPHRSHTAVVVSYRPGELLRIDAQAVAAKVGPETKVFEIANGIETRHLERGLPEHLHIFGIGARVYPHGPDWTARMPRPHLIHHESELTALFRDLDNEVLAALPVETTPPPTTAQLPIIADAIVEGFAGTDRAMVTILKTSKTAFIRGEDLLPEIPLDWLISKGQTLSGTFDPATGILDIKALLLPRASPVTVYKHGNVALARVKSVSPTHAMVHLWPNSDFRIGVERISSNDLDSAEDLLTEGEVVRVRVLYENGAVRLSMLDVDDDEAAVPAPPLLRGGPPWLDSDRPYASLFADSAVAPVTPSVPSEGDETVGSDVVLGAVEAPLSSAERRTALQSTQMQLAVARRTIDELMVAAKRQGATDQVARVLQDQLESERRAAADLARDRNAAMHQIDALKGDLAKAKASLVQLRQQKRSASSRTGSSPETLFLDPAEQFEFGLLTAWAQAVPAADKAAHPIGKYSCSPRFLASWIQLTEQQRGKTLRAVVDLVADRKGPLRKREPHLLRLNEGAHAGVTLRGDDVCWRLYVEQGTAAALRLHYWKLAAGGVELHEVVPHDVVKP
ncbi:hypothetical protein CVS30_04755 [Arthrobacter psychrolactophilus]|uniref:S1 motif domain-containing protein n=1 Tax=Arthrobacter psychrolactophilus TaxID=92442 RepID=A0A2V5IV87_9MICC|nr:hypothetical protein [Arthrobacter psychrolactophilus]PYI39282.1 hypothetical protein CVS30_04755 [Arthrobacter psychrolactophilus]